MFCPLQNLLNETNTYKESYTEPDNQDQAADDKDIVLDDVDHLKESTTVIDTNVETVEGVSEIVADGEMKINSDAHQVKNLHKQASDGGFSTDVAHSSGGFDEVMTVDSAKTVLDGSSAAGDSGAFAIVAPESSNADSTSREGITGGSSTQRVVPSQIVSDELVSDYRLCAW
ncbi:uncharacterized protein A4U43_UnF680 [Asparagus officinalis]|uniref:Uncharacterized protein n=1 Tax=Asparagus officinalis TaxID=4686 RepID=A0A1R3L7M4_ASPOF|nr:uncharacterized protein A4U43_UnF680 [Asparagus officinalis]